MTLKELRERHAYRPVDIAAQCNAGMATVRAWERGEKKPSPPQIRALASLYGVSIDEIHCAIEESAQSEE
jgi:DNA-binding transcriptional regulator YiaG